MFNKAMGKNAEPVTKDAKIRAMKTQLSSMKTEQQRAVHRNDTELNEILIISINNLEHNIYELQKGI